MHVLMEWIPKYTGCSYALTRRSQLDTSKILEICWIFHKHEVFILGITDTGKCSTNHPKKPSYEVT